MEPIIEKKSESRWTLLFSIFVSALFVILAFVYRTGVSVTENRKTQADKGTFSPVATDMGKTGNDAVELPVRWGDLGVRLVGSGVIDASKFEELYMSRGGMDADMRKLLYEKDNGNLVITQENSGYLLNLLWALGLGNKNPVLEKGPMMDPRYGGPDRFASTGGWTLAKDGPMNHYSKHSFVSLTQDQQALVERVSQNIYRPCCGNSTYFPDCNHGMAMLGFLELLASQDATEDTMYRVALQVNSYWFPDTYLTIDAYLKTKGSSLMQADPKELLSERFSSASGYQDIKQQVGPAPKASGGGCGT
ncbi:MAG: hypothetical protein AAB631_02990 [Patescibacteria group bacterium]